MTQMIIWLQSTSQLSSFMTKPSVIVIAGDFNASLHRSKPTARDKKFEKFIKEGGFTPAYGTTDLPSYHGNNGSSSKIDYALVHKQSFLSRGIPVNSVKIILHECLEESPENNSTHDLWGFEIVLESKDVNSVDPPQPNVTTRIQWDKIDENVYQSNLYSLLSQQFEIFNSPENIPVLAEAIPSAFIAAAESTGEIKVAKQPKSYKSDKSRDLWKAELYAKQKYRAWVNENKPGDPQNKYFVEKTEAKKQLRHIKNLERIKQGQEENVKLMETKKGDMKQFSRLVNSTKNTVRGETAMLIIDDKEYAGDGQVLAGFFNFHKDACSSPELTQTT